MGQKVYVAMSGGVDSSVSAALLKEEGYDVRGVYLYCWDESDAPCTTMQDKRDAIRIASLLDIPIQVWDFQKEYRQYVFDTFTNKYDKGLTPNPDILCNSRIKFGHFYKKVKEIDPKAKIATGHYARVTSSYFLKKAKDDKKDQSYFLYRVTPQILKDTIFPLGNLRKDEVRRLALERGLYVANKPDSQGLCFVGKANIYSLLQKHTNSYPVTVINIKGEVLGSVNSISSATIGQRHGFKVKNENGTPYFVVDKDLESGLIVVGAKEHAFSNEVFIRDLFVPKGGIFSLEGKLFARVRHLGKLTPVRIIPKTDTKNGVYVRFFHSVFALAPGQHVVFYDSEGVVKGGGEITKVNTDYKKRFTIPNIGS